MDARDGSLASGGCWSRDDISVLTALLEPSPPTQDPSHSQQRTSESTHTADRKRGRSITDHPGYSEDESQDQDKGEDDDDDEEEEEEIDTDLITSLKRQVHLLQQKHDRDLEQRVAKSVIAAGGRSAPRAATIRLYRQYERLRRVAASLEIENQRLAARLREHQTRRSDNDERIPRPGPADLLTGDLLSG